MRARIANPRDHGLKLYDVLTEVPSSAKCNCACRPYKKISFTRTKNGFPPLFKMEENLADIFVSQKGKEALEKQNIKGCIFEQIEVSN